MRRTGPTSDEFADACRPPTTPSERAARGVRRAVNVTAGWVAGGAFNFIGSLTRPIPVFGERIWGGMAKRSLYYYYKSTGADRMGLEIMPSGEAVWQPIKYKPPENTDLEEAPGWYAKGRDKVWKPTADGQGGPRLHKTPILPLSSEAWRSTSVLESRITEAVDQGDHRPLYSLEEADLTVTLDAEAAGGPEEALADGGYQEATINPRDLPVYQDEIVELNTDDHDGQAISFQKYKEMFLESATTEEMSLHEDRAFLAGRSKQDMKSFALKVFLIAAVVAIAGLVGKELIAALFGGGTGGVPGGGSLPITALADSLVGAW